MTIPQAGGGEPMEARYIVDENGKRTDVILPLEEYERLIEALADLDRAAIRCVPAAVQRGHAEECPEHAAIQMEPAGAPGRGEDRAAEDRRPRDVPERRERGALRLGLDHVQHGPVVGVLDQRPERVAALSNAE